LLHSPFLKFDGF